MIFTPKQKAGEIPADFPALELKEEAEAQVLYGEGGPRQVWALDTKSKGAVILFEAEAPKHLQTMIDTFPLIKADDVDYQILPLVPYPAFAKKPRSRYPFGEKIHAHRPFTMPETACELPCNDLWGQGV